MPARAKWWWRVPLVTLGAFMSFWRLDVPSWNFDELLYTDAGDRYWAGDFSPNPEHPPLGKYIIGLSRLTLGPSLWAGRLPAAAAMLAVGLLLWWWLDRIAPRPAGPVAAALWWTLPSLSTFPEVEGGSVWALRYALLDPFAALFALAAVVAGWWWVRCGLVRAAVLSGVLAGLAVATKLPAALVVAVPAVTGCAAVLARPPLAAAAKVLRAVGHGAVWAASAGSVFVVTYLPMGTTAPATFVEGWKYQREHGSVGHLTLVADEVTGRPPWWSLVWWQYVALGGAATALLLACTVAAAVGRPLLGGYLTVAWLAPVLLILPLGRVALPYYLQLWRPELVAVAAVGAAAAGTWAWRRLPRLVAGALVVAAAAAVLVPTGRAVSGVARLAPSDYAALPGLVPPTGEVWLAGRPTVAAEYLPGRVHAGPRPGVIPAAVVLDRAVTTRLGSGGLVPWVQAHGYHRTRTGVLEVWLPAGQHSSG